MDSSNATVTIDQAIKPRPRSAGRLELKKMADSLGSRKKGEKRDRVGKGRGVKDKEGEMAVLTRLG